MVENRHPCEICQRLVGPGFLMCPAHWRLVPAELQRAVWRTWRPVQRGIGSPHERLQHISNYRKARDAAVAAVREAVDSTAGGLL